MADKNYDGMMHYVLRNATEEHVEELRYLEMMHLCKDAKDMKKDSSFKDTGFFFISVDATKTPNSNMRNFEAGARASGIVLQKTNDISEFLGSN